VQRFLDGVVFKFPGGSAQRDNVADFVMVFDADQAPVVGQQVTLSPDSPAAAGARIDLLIARASVTSPRPECDLIVKAVVAGAARGWVRTSSGLFRSDRASEPLLADRDLRALASVRGQDLTYTAVPPGSGARLGIDRDGDGFYDADETDARSDPANAASTPLDRDGDGVPNAADCAPDDPGSFGVPAEVAGLAVAAVNGGVTQWSWAPQSATAGPGTDYDLASGTLADLRANGGFANASCVDGSSQTASWIDSSNGPSPGAGFWYLVRARNACGIGSYGTGALGSARTVTACP